MKPSAIIPLFAILLPVCFTTAAFAQAPGDGGNGNDGKVNASSNTSANIGMDHGRKQHGRLSIKKVEMKKKQKEAPKPPPQEKNILDNQKTLKSPNGKHKYRFSYEERGDQSRKVHAEVLDKNDNVVRRHANFPTDSLLIADQGHSVGWDMGPYGGPNMYFFGKDDSLVKTISNSGGTASFWTDDGKYLIEVAQFRSGDPPAPLENTSVFSFKPDGSLVFKREFDSSSINIHRLDGKIVVCVYSHSRGGLAEVLDFKGHVLKTILPAALRSIKKFKNGYLFIERFGIKVLDWNFKVISQFTLEAEKRVLKDAFISPEGNHIVVALENRFLGVVSLKTPPPPENWYVKELVVLTGEGKILTEEPFEAPSVGVEFVDENKFTINTDDAKYEATINPDAK